LVKKFLTLWPSDTAAFFAWLQALFTSGSADWAGILTSKCDSSALLLVVGALYPSLRRQHRVARRDRSVVCATM